MKRSLLAFVFAALFLLSSCAAPKIDPPEETEVPFSVQEAEITEGSHQREEYYLSAFNTRAIKTPFFTVHMEEGIFEESALRASAEKLYNDAKTVSGRTGERIAPDNIYIVGKRIKSNPSSVRRNVFITREELDSGEYRSAFIKAGYSLSAEWQIIGLIGYAFGEAPDESGLKEYYSDPSHIMTASCSPLFLEPALAGEQTAEIARKTAKSLAAFIIENSGFEAFIEARDTSGHLSGWFGHIGAEEGSLPEGSENAADLRLVMDGFYICRIEAENYTICITNDGWTVDPAEIYPFVCVLLAGTARIKENIKAELPSLSELIDERFSEPIDIVFSDPSTVLSYTVPAWNTICLSDPSSIFHELIHIVLEPYRVEPANSWLSEAIAEHFSCSVTDEYYPSDYISRGFDAYVDFYNEYFGPAASEGDMIFHRSVYAVYNEIRTYEGDDRDDTYALKLSHGVCSILLDGVERTQIRMKYDRPVSYEYDYPVSGPKEEDGNSLSYPQSLAVFLYLCKTYGEEKTVCDYLNGLFVEEMTGKPYPDIYSDARAYYEGLYGYLTAD